MGKNLISVDWLKEHLQDPKVRVIDCRFQLTDPDAGYQAYQQGHIPGAVYFDLDKDLASQPGQHEGRHPLPDPDTFADKLGKAGIDETVKVIAYDDQGGMVASRLWWMLKYLGHQQAYVLNGTFSLWESKGYPVTTDTSRPEPKKFTYELQTHMIADVELVKQKKHQANTILIDSRENKRYLGLEEPIDPVAGHIPGALNYFWKDNLMENGTWKTAQQQKERFQKLNPDQEVIVYCGSGVSACPNFLALDEAGYSKIKLYVGSWSDWCSYPDNPIATEEE